MLKNVLVVLVLILMTFKAPGQTPDTQTGISPYSSYDFGELGSVSLANGNLNFKIPLASYPQRGNRLKLSFSMLYNGKSAVETQICPNPPGAACHWTFVSPLNVESGFSLVDDQQVFMPATHYSWCSGGSCALYSNYYFTTSDGAIHPAGEVSGSNNVQVSLDGSHLSAVAPWKQLSTDPSPPPTVITDAAGVSYFPDTSTGIYREDADGNEISIAKDILTDTLGRTVPLSPAATSNYSGCGGPLPTTSAFSWQPPGYSAPFKFCYAEINISIPYKDCVLTSSSTAIYTASAVSSLQSIVLPNGKNWTFLYEASAPTDPSGTRYPDVSEIIFPTGGSVSYAYEFRTVPGGSGDSCSSWVTSRTVNPNDGTGSHTWKYTWGPETYNTSTETTTAVNTVTDPANEDTVHSFFGYNNSQTLLEQETQYYPGSAQSTQPLKSVATQYQYTQEYYGNQSVTAAFPSTITTTLANGQTSQKVMQYCCSYSFGIVDGIANAPNEQQFYTATYGLPSDVKEYDFGASAPGPLLRETATSYYWQTYPAYQTANLLTLPAMVTTKNASGTQVAQTTYTYDEGTYTSQTSGVTEQHGAPPSSEDGVFGHLTTRSDWLNTGGSIQTHNYWYDTGTLQKSLDGKGNATTYTYSPTDFGAYLTQKTNALGQSTAYTWVTATGQLQSVQDPNDIAAKRAGTVYGYDDMLNLSSVSYPDGGSVSYNYNGYDLPLTVTATQAATPDPSIITTTVYDGLGRTSSQTKGEIIVGTTYDSLERPYCTSNPHYSTPSAEDGQTCTSYDALNRVTTITHQDNSTSQWTYTGNAIDFLDEVGHHWQRTVDARGRVTKVLEPNSSNAPTNETDYTYDALDNLTNVGQWGGSSGSSGEHLRLFTYDSLSRLLNSCNPESIPMGSACSTNGPWSSQNIYDADSNVQTRTDAKGVKTSYTYDALDRVTAKTYSDSTALNNYYLYDVDGSCGNEEAPIGRLTAAWTSASTTNLGANYFTDPNLVGYDCYSHEVMGRINTSDEGLTLPGTSVQEYGGGPLYQYDLAGNPTLVWWAPNFNDPFVQPMHSFTYSYDDTGRLAKIVLNPNSTTDIYDSYGVPTSIPTTLFNAAPSGSQPAYSALGLEHAELSENVAGSPILSYSHAFNKRGWPVSSTYTTGSLAVDGAGLNGYSYTVSSYLANGSVGNVTDSVLGTLGTGSGGNISYDSLNRMTGLSYSGGAYGGLSFAWGYDNFGNRLNQTVSGSSAVSVPSSTSAKYDTQNHINFSSRTGAALPYDGNGNLQSDALNSYAYDVENRLCAAKVGSTYWVYVYDAAGNRIAKGTITPPAGTTTATSALCNPTQNNLSLTEIYAFDLNGRETETYDPSDNWKSTNVYADGQLIATYAGDYMDIVMNDWQGTRRAKLPNNASLSSGLTDFLSLPFGDGYAMVGGNGSSDTTVQFTGKEYDQETGLYNFGARYDGDWMGRFMSPDWSAKAQAVPYAKWENPQSLNLYAFVGNNPLSGVDPDGHFLAGADDEVWNGTSQGVPNSCNLNQPSECSGFGADSQTAENSYAQLVAAQQQNSGQQPAPTNPDGSQKSPANDVPSLPDGKGPDGKLRPNEWEIKPGSGKDSRTKWGPKYPVPGGKGGQPSASWDPDGHWDHDNGQGDRTRWLPGGLPTIHQSVQHGYTIDAGTAAKATFWGTVGAITIQVLRALGSAEAIP